MSSRKTIAVVPVRGIKGNRRMTEHDQGGPASGDRAVRAEQNIRGQGLSDHTQKRIGVHLRTMYDAVVQQPVPDRFRDLIARLEALPSDETTL
jgi:hypothetical protein